MQIQQELVEQLLVSLWRVQVVEPSRREERGAGLVARKSGELLLRASHSSVSGENLGMAGGGKRQEVTYVISVENQPR